MSLIRKPKRNKTVRQEPVYVVRGGVQYQIMEIAGEKMEIRVATKQDVEDFRNNKSTYSHPA